MTYDELLIITTGGTIDKVYFDARSDYQVGDTIIPTLLAEAQVTHPFKVLPLLQKDSLELNEDDRDQIKAAIDDTQNTRIIVTHGTDTMTETARHLNDIKGKTVVLTGALSPARFAMTDAMFNVGMAIAAAQTLDSGVYIVMNGTVFDAANVRKNLDVNRFEHKF